MIGSRAFSLAFSLAARGAPARTLFPHCPLRSPSFSHTVSTPLRGARRALSASGVSSPDPFVGVRTLLFDLDGTLYSGDAGDRTKEYMTSRIFQYMVERTSSDSGGDTKFDAITTVEEAKAVWLPLFRRYNQSLRGLKAAGYVIDEGRWNAFFREGMEELLERDDALRACLESLPQRKVVFTNAPEASARKCLEALGVSDLFVHVYGAETMGSDRCKPERAAFEAVFSVLGVDVDDPGACAEICFFEDSVANARAGAALGMQTVLVECSTAQEEGEGDGGKLREEFGAVVNDLGRELRKAAPGLWL